MPSLVPGRDETSHSRALNLAQQGMRSPSEFAVQDRLQSMKELDLGTR